MTTELPVTTIAGYLGAGKTTLINHLLRHANGLRLAVMVNDFGELEIDADLIEAEDDDIISIAGGCVCCSFGNDLSLALVQLQSMQPVPDHIVIEASGVAIPSAIVASVGLIDGFRTDGTVTLVDTETVQENAANRYVGDTVQRQIVDADLLVLTKADLVLEAALETTTNWLGEINPRATTIVSENGALPLAAILESQPAQTNQQPLLQHADLFETFSCKPKAIVSADHLLAALEASDLGIVRAKGFVEDQAGRKLLLHGVGRRWSLSPTDSDHETGLVIIGLKQQLKRGEILDLFE